MSAYCPGMASTDEPCWTIDELHAELQRYAAELREAGRSDATVAIYVDRPARFLRWLVGEYSPRAKPGRPSGAGPSAADEISALALLCAPTPSAAPAPARAARSWPPAS